MNDYKEVTDVLGNPLREGDYFVDIDDYTDPDYGGLVVVYVLYTKGGRFLQKRHSLLKKSRHKAYENMPTIFDDISINNQSHFNLLRAKLPRQLVEPEVKKREIQAYLGLCGYPVELEDS